MPSVLALSTIFSNAVQEGIRFLAGEVTNFAPPSLNMITSKQLKLPVFRSARCATQLRACFSRSSLMFLCNWRGQSNRIGSDRILNAPDSALLNARLKRRK